MFSDNLCSFYTLSLNNLVNFSTEISSVVAIKYAIFDNLLYTTGIMFFSTTSDSLVIKFTIRYIYHFSEILFAINFPISISVLFFILWYRLQLSIYLSISLVTLEHQFYCLLSFLIFNHWYIII